MGDVLVGGAKESTWAYGGGLPGTELRLTRGRRALISLENGLQTDTTIHWHGIRLRNAVDGVPDLTQDPVGPKSQFLYDFVPPDAGTFFYHPHVGVQNDTAMYGPLIVEDPGEKLGYDVDVPVVIDDWLGDGGDPDKVLKDLQTHGMMGSSGGMGGMHMGQGSGGGMSGGMGMMASPAMLARMDTAAASGPFRTPSGAVPRIAHAAGLTNALVAGATHSGDVPHTTHLINGAPPQRPALIEAKQGQTVRLRLINAGADTMYLVHGDGVPMTVVAADGMRTEPLVTDAVLMGMAERYDVLVKVGARPIRIVARPMGKAGVAMTVVGPRGSASKVGMSTVNQPVRVAGPQDLTQLGGSRPARAARVVKPLVLTMSMPYEWAVEDPDGSTGDITVNLGDRVRFAMTNKTGMVHPMHFHGHSFREVQGRTYGPLKDTINIAPGQTVTVDVKADNPGKWMLHCHNAYHLAANMMRTVIVKS